MEHYTINKGTPKSLHEAFAKAMHEYKHGPIDPEGNRNFKFSKDKVNKAVETLEDYILQKFQVLMMHPNIVKSETIHLRCLLELIGNGNWDKFKDNVGLGFPDK